MCTLHSPWFYHPVHFKVCVHYTHCGFIIQYSSGCSVQGMCTLHSLWFYHPVHFKVCVHYTHCGFIIQYSSGCSVQDMCTLHSLWFCHPVQQWVQCSRYVYTTLTVVLSSSTACKTYILPVLLYWCETWTIWPNASMPSTPGVCVKFLRIPYTRHTTNETVRSITGCSPVSESVKCSRLKFFMHLARSVPEEDVTVSSPPHCDRQLP